MRSGQTLAKRNPGKSDILISTDYFFVQISFSAYTFLDIDFDVDIVIDLCLPTFCFPTNFKIWQR